MGCFRIMKIRHLPFLLGISSAALKAKMRYHKAFL